MPDFAYLPDCAAISMPGPRGLAILHQERDHINLLEHFDFIVVGQREYHPHQQVVQN